jgi:hypothetical protein
MYQLTITARIFQKPTMCFNNLSLILSSGNMKHTSWILHHYELYLKTEPLPRIQQFEKFRTMPCAEINRDAVWTERMSEEREIQILLTS